MDRHRFYTVGLVILLLAIVGNTYLSLQGRSELRHTQTELVRSQKESTETRITTVTQRCGLTKLILDVLDKQDPSVSGAFHQSYAGCEKQLAHVIAINRRTPSPK